MPLIKKGINEHKEKINCKAYDTLVVEILSFIHSRYLNNPGIDPKCAEGLIQACIEDATQKGLDSFFRSYLNE